MHPKMCNKKSFLTLNISLCLLSDHSFLKLIQQKCLFKHVFRFQQLQSVLPFNACCLYLSVLKLHQINFSIPYFLVRCWVTQKKSFQQTSSNKSLMILSFCGTSNEMGEVIGVVSSSSHPADLSPCHLPSSPAASRASLGTRRVKIREKVLCFDSSSTTAGQLGITKGYEENWRG